MVTILELILNLPGSSGADKGKEIYSIGEGFVTYAGRAGTWGNIIVIEHPEAKLILPDGQTGRQTVFSRYGHVDSRILVNKGQSCKSRPASWLYRITCKSNLGMASPF